MNADTSSAISQMRAVTVSREYGSGGGEIARRLATHLGWQLIDHEIVGQVAQELQISEQEAEAYDEHVESAVSMLLSGMRATHPAMFSMTSPPLMAGSQVYHEALERMVEAAVTAGHVVIVGRASQVLLANRHDVLHIRIVAPLEERIAYVMQREGLDKISAQSRIQQKDHDRCRYLQSEYQHRPDEAHLYDLTINAHILDLDSIVDIVILALERKASRLSIPTEELGPGVGLSRYPASPGDFHSQT